MKNGGFSTYIKKAAAPLAMTMAVIALCSSCGKTDSETAAGTSNAASTADTAPKTVEETGNTAENRPLTSFPATEKEPVTSKIAETVPAVSTSNEMTSADVSAPKTEIGGTDTAPITTERKAAKTDTEKITTAAAPITTLPEIAGDPIITPSGRVLQPQVKSVIAKAPDSSWGTGIGTPSVIVLEHSGDKNGLVVAAYSVGDSGLTGGPTSIRIARSFDGGKTFKTAAKVYESFDSSIEACWNPHLFELPCDVGDMPEGTLLLAAVSIDAGQSRKSTISIWRSFDQGKRWEQYSVIAEGGGLGEGVWEPFLVYENGYLYCFYSDDSPKTNSQSLVYKKSTDGKDWSQSYDMVAPDDYKWRPGMAVIAKMGNGKYFAVYEVGYEDVGGVPIYYKITDSLDSWDEKSLGKQLTAKGGETCGSAPWCAWSPVGGECGTLIVSAKYGTENNEFFVSYDYGESFELVENIFEYPSDNGYGYSASLFFSADGRTLYYANTTDNGGGKAKIEFAKIKLG